MEDLGSTPRTWVHLELPSTLSPLYINTLQPKPGLVPLPVRGEEGLKTSMHEVDTAKLKRILSSCWCSCHAVLFIKNLLFESVRFFLPLAHSFLNVQKLSSILFTDKTHLSFFQGNSRRNQRRSVSFQHQIHEPTCF